LAKRRVVVTGLGMVSPVGLDVATSWENILAGKSGIETITHFDTTPFSTRFGGTVKGFDVTRYMPAKEARKMDPFIHYGIAAADEALEDSGLEVTEENAERIGVAIGSGIGGLPGIEKGHAAYMKGGPRKISPFFVPANIINMISGHVSIRHGLKGPNIALVTACPVVLVDSAPPGRFPPATTIPPEPADPGMWSGTASCSVTVPGWWCWRSTNMPAGGVPPSTPKWPVTE